MAKSTFQGPVRSLNGFFNTGPGTMKSITANTTLTGDGYAGRLITISNASAVITLPTINASADSAYAGPGSDPNNSNNLGAVYQFYVGVNATAMSICTDGTDKFVGSITLANAASTLVFQPAASNDFINMNGSTKGGLIGSVITVEAIAANQYMVQGVLIGSGTLATPFADS